MAVITNSGVEVEVDLPNSFSGNHDTPNDRDAEAASTSSYEEDDTFSISSADGGKSWMWNSINPMNIFMMLFVVILLVLTGGLSATAAKSNVVDNMSSNIKAPKASKGPTAKSTKGPTCIADGEGKCATNEDCCAGLSCGSAGPLTGICSPDGEN